MALDFNVDPWYDDFDETKNFHRILFRPGRAVQARELTQSQTILQDQITKFADNIFKQNSPVSGGQITTNFKSYYIKLQSTYNDVAIDLTDWYDATTDSGKLIRNADGSVVARVLQVVDPTGVGGAGDPPTLIVTYKTGSQFQNNDVIYDVDSSAAVQAIASGSTGLSSLASIAYGVFYVLGNFVQIQPQTIVIDKYNNSPSKRIGLQITESWRDYIDDSSLLDPALGASNYQAPGADRYYIGLELSSRPIQFGDDQNFVELVRVTDGTVQKLVDGSVYNVIDDYFAKRDFETNGDYVVNDFKLTPKTNANTELYTMSVGKGLAYVHGYRVESTLPTDIESTRARTTDSLDNNPVYIDYGNYFYVDTIKGANSSSFITSQAQTIDLHCVPSANVDTSTLAKYTATVVGSGYIRGLKYSNSTSDTNANTYVYKAFVYNVSNKSPSANAASGASSTITLPSSYSGKDDAYVGVNISIVAGPSAGDFRTITAYNGTTKVATVNQAWTTTPTNQSTFVLNFDTKDTEAILSVNQTATTNIPIYAKANINAASGKINGDTVLKNAKYPEMLFNIGNPYVKTLTSTSYETEMVFDVSFQTAGSGVTADISFQNQLSSVYGFLGTHGRALSTDEVKDYFTIIVTDKGSNSTFANGDVVEWTSTNRSVTINSDGSQVTFTATSGISSFTAKIIAKVNVDNANSNYVRKYKKLVTADTSAVVGTSGTQVNTWTYVDDSTNSKGQIYIKFGGLADPGVQQSLYLSDVKRIVKIIDTKDPATSADTSMFTNSTYDVTNNFTFDNGQRDSFYDHASIKLKTGAPKPKGNLLVLVDYYKHYGGDGYFCVASYTDSTAPEHYQEIPIYRATSGLTYNLRDVLDFRPARVNASSTFDFKYSGLASAVVGLNLPVDLEKFQGNYSYYLGRKDKLVLTKDKSFQIIEGAPSLSPISPAEPDGSLVIANITHDPYTGYIPTEAPAGVLSNLDVDKVQHKRYTMQDISGLEKRINQMEYYTSLSLLEQKTSSMQISDSFGLNRFKNGILVDDFSSFSTADTAKDFSVNINRRERTMTAAQDVKNYPFKSIALNNSLGKLNTDLGYNISTDGLVNYFTLPYTTANAAIQKFASRTVNVNPFSFTTEEGTLALTPNMDNWVDTNYAPALLITDPNMQVFQESDSVNVLKVGDWKAIPGTSTITVKDVVNHGRFYNDKVATSNPYGVGYEETTTTYQATQTNLYGTYSNINNTYALNNGYITDISLLPYMRSQQIVVRAKGMLFSTTVNSYFDNTNVDNYFRKANVIELTGVSGNFTEGDIVGFYTGSVFTKTGRIVGVYKKTSTTTRLYVAADASTTTYTSTGTITNGKFDSSGAYVPGSSTASGTYSSTINYGGSIKQVVTEQQVKLSPLASSTDDYYKNSKIYIVGGPGAGTSATISAYNGTTKIATLSTALTGVTTSSEYSVGTLKTDEEGSLYGVFMLPEGTFHSGQRVFRLDNSVGNSGAATTFSQSTYYAEGLQTTQQGLDFGASPAGAKNTFWATSGPKTISSSTYSPWDPVAQSFIFSKDDYPNGLFLDSISLFFRTKPSSDKSPITLSIVGTQNGIPTGTTLDHSVVTLGVSDVVAGTSYTEEPQYLDSRTKTTFKFSAPIYIQPEVLYAFILKSNSKEYTLWSTSNGDTALKSSTKNLPSDATPQVATKISSAPYVGGLFLSQNSQTWTPDQNQALMFVIDRCKFDVSSKSVAFVIPKKLPQRTIYNQSLIYSNNANNISTTADLATNEDQYYDALNISTTDFIPSKTDIKYSYVSSIAGGGVSTSYSINPGKFGTPTTQDLYLDDGKGRRVLYANTDSSLLLTAEISTSSDAISPVISDAGLSAYTVKYTINNCELSNTNITVANTGSGYNALTTSVTFSAPTGVGGTQAYGVANVVNGTVDAVYITTPGSGYITTPTASIVDANSSPGANARVIISGETSKSGGNALSKYYTKKVTLDDGFDSGDINVYLTGYRPVGTDINVYYRITNKNDTQKFEEGNWQLMTKINGTESKYSSNRSDLYEYQFAPGTGNVDQGYVSYTSSATGSTYTTFNQFAIKVVLTTADTTSVPVVYDLRAIALPPNVNTTF